MATAAVLDASRKDKRREELDRRIDDARARLAQLVEQSTALDLASFEEEVAVSAANAAEPQAKVAHILRSMCLPRDSLLEVHRRNRSRSLFADKRHREVGFGRRPKTDIPLGFGKIKSRIMEEERDFDNDREPSTEQHVTRTKNMINDLVDNLLMQALREDDVVQPGIMASSLRALDSAWAYIRMIRNEGYPSFVAASLNPTATRGGRRKLNEANDKVLAMWTSERKRNPVAKICYNLLISHATPSIHNYNALLLGFLGKGELGLSKHVVDSFFQKSKFRPTQQTLVCLLHYYRMSNDVAGFYRLVRRMIAKDSRGIRSRRRHTSHVFHSSVLQEWASRPEVTMSGGYFLERAKFDSDIFDALIKGFLHFDHLEQAAKVFAAAVREGFDITIDSLKRLLERCVAETAHFACRIVLDGLRANVGDTTEFILSGSCSDEVVDTLVRVFDICFYEKRLDAPQKSVLWVAQGDFEDGDLSAISSALFIRNVQRFSDRVGRLCRRMDSILRSAGRPLQERLGIALDVLTRVERHEAAEYKDGRRFQQMMWLSKLDERLRMLDLKALNTERELMRILADSLPWAYRRSFHSTKNSLAARLEQHLELRSQADLGLSLQILLLRLQQVENELKSELMGWLPRAETQILSAAYSSVEKVPIAALVAAMIRHLGPAWRGRVTMAEVKPAAAEQEYAGIRLALLETAAG